MGERLLLDNCPYVRSEARRRLLSFVNRDYGPRPPASSSIRKHASRSFPILDIWKVVMEAAGGA